MAVWQFAQFDVIEPRKLRNSKFEGNAESSLGFCSHKISKLIACLQCSLWWSATMLTWHRGSTHSFSMLWRLSGCTNTSVTLLKTERRRAGDADKIFVVDRDAGAKAISIGSEYHIHNIHPSVIYTAILTSTVSQLVFIYIFASFHLQTTWQGRKSSLITAHKKVTRDHCLAAEAQCSWHHYYMYLRSSDRIDINTG